MTTDAQIAANRANASKSTGPVTAQGKAAVRRNAVKHGFLARSLSIDNAPFVCLVEEFAEAVVPQDQAEQHLVEQLASAYLRLVHVHRQSHAALQHGWIVESQIKPMMLLIRYEAMLNRQIERIHNLLRRSNPRAARFTSIQPQPLAPEDVFDPPAADLGATAPLAAAADLSCDRERAGGTDPPAEADVALIHRATRFITNPAAEPEELDLLNRTSHGHLMAVADAWSHGIAFDLNATDPSV